MMGKASTERTSDETITVESANTAETPAPVQNDKRRYNKWNLKYLQFVDSFISQVGMNYNEAAAKAGITRQTIYHWFDNDDAKIASVISFINKCGYKIKFALKPKSNIIGDALVTINSRDSVTPSGDRNLSFLEDAFNQYRIEKKATAEKLGLGYPALYFWFRHDDVYISYVYRIAEMYDLKVIIQIDPK